MENYSPETIDREKREAGRYRKSSEDKAKPFPLKLHQDYIDRLSFMPGKNNAEKIRGLIDRSADWYERERRQIKEIRRLIGPLYRQAKELIKPELREQNDKFSMALERFRHHLKTLETLLEVMHFDFSSLKPHLDERDIIELEIIFAAKQSYL